MTAIHLHTHLHDQLARAVQWTASVKLAARQRRWRVMHAIAASIDFIARALFYLQRNHRYLSCYKLANMALVNIQFMFKTERVIGRPYSMKIEPTNICNTKCQLCPTGIGLEGRPKGKMDFDKYAKLVDQLKSHLLDLDLSMWGDPLIVPDIFKMIRHAHDRKIWTYISSNLHAFKIGPRKDGTEQAVELVNSGLNLMTCSLHGATQETYEIYQPGKRLDESVAKIKHIIETRDRMGAKTPQVQLNFVVTKYNEHEKPAFKKLAAELGCRPVFSTPALNTRFLNQDKQLVSLNLNGQELKQKTENHIRKWLPNDTEHILPAYLDMLKGKYDDGDYNGQKAYNCSWPWRQSVINWDGQVVTCCGSFDPGEDMGSVFDQPFAKIWNGPKYRASRRSFKHKLNAETTENNACANCPGFMV